MNKLKQRIKDKLGEKKTASLKKALKIIRTVKNVICWVLVAVLTVAVIAFMVTKIAGGTPSVFGYSLHQIISGSMEPELHVGDVIVGKDVTDPGELHVSDIITFQGDERFENQKVTHRVLVSPYDNGKGELVLVTKGDANETDDGEIRYSDVESKLVTKVEFLRQLYSFFFSQWGLIIFIFLLLLIFFDEIMNIVKLIISGGEQEETETLSEVIERIQREQQASLEQKQLSEGNADDKESDPSTDAEKAASQNDDYTKESESDQKNDDNTKEAETEQENENKIEAKDKQKTDSDKKEKSGKTKNTAQSGNSKKKSAGDIKKASSGQSKNKSNSKSGNKKQNNKPNNKKKNNKKKSKKKK